METSNQLNQGTVELQETAQQEQPEVKVEDSTSLTQDTQLASASATPAQKQLPADSYVYANNSNLGSTIQYVAKQYNVDPHRLETLTHAIRSKEAYLTGYLNMQVGYYPGMTAESLVHNLGRVAKLSNDISAQRKQEAELNGEEYQADDMEELINSLRMVDDTKDAKAYFYETLNAIQESDHVKFDTPALTERYELLIKSGKSKGEAWDSVIRLQDEYRKSQKIRAASQDMKHLISINDMQQYVSGLYEQAQTTSDPEQRILLYTQYETANKLLESYTKLYESDPAAYFQSKDPAFETIIQQAQDSGDFSSVVKNLDSWYEEQGVPYSHRKYLTKKQVQTISKEINTFMGSDPIKAQSAVSNIVAQYGPEAGKIIRQLYADGEVSADAALLVEAVRTGSVLTNEDVLTMYKYKAAHGKNFMQEMFNAPNAETAKILAGKLSDEIVKLPGVKTILKQMELEGDIMGKENLIASYTNLAAYYKYKNPSYSDKRIAKMIQANMIDSVYAQDTEHRITLSKTTIDGRPIMYNGYTAEKAVEYLTNRGFTGQDYTIGALSQKESELLLRNKHNIRYLTSPDNRKVRPVYDDGKGVVQELFDKNNKVVEFDLKHLGDEDLLGIFDARDKARSLYKVLSEASRMQTMERAREHGYGLDQNSINAIKTLHELGFTLDKFDGSKTFAEQFERSSLTPRRLEALSTVLSKYTEFEQELKTYENMKRSQRGTLEPVKTSFAIIDAFVHDNYLHPIKKGKSERLVKRYEDQRTKYLPTLKAQRVKLFKLEEEIMNEACIYLDYKGKLPLRPLTKEIHKHNLMDKILWGGYGY